MSPIEIGRSYDAITDRWSSPRHPLPGVPAHQRAVQFLNTRRPALDAGCGCNGRLTDYLESLGFAVEGVDVSHRMIELARRRNSRANFYHADLCQWQLPRKYDLITAWDSVWHIPLARQPAVLGKLCSGLDPAGVVIFTTGGTDQPAEVHDSPMGVPMYTATLGIPQTLALLAEYDCVCRHLEFDQWPHSHVYIIAQRRF
jgi:SAM-dependent methyltransferase